jgi:hypothetical protein
MTLVRAAAPAQRVRPAPVGLELGELVFTQRASDAVPAMAQHLQAAIDGAGET